MDSEEAIILKFLQSHPMATISTSMPGSLQPESPLIAFTQTEKLEIVFETFVDTRKLRNLQKNPHVALVIGWDVERHITLQYEGLANPISADKTDAYIELFLAKKTPCTEIFLHDPRVRLYKITPTWIRYSDYTIKPARIIEKNFGRKGKV